MSHLRKTSFPSPVPSGSMIPAGILKEKHQALRLLICVTAVLVLVTALRTFKAHHFRYFFVRHSVELQRSSRKWKTLAYARHAETWLSTTPASKSCFLGKGKFNVCPMMCSAHLVAWNSRAAEDDSWNVGLPCPTHQPIHYEIIDCELWIMHSLYNNRTMWYIFPLTQTRHFIIPVRVQKIYSPDVDY